METFRLLRKYGNPTYPTHCEHDELGICGVSPTDVSDEDKKRLEELGFINSDDEYFLSYRYGSA